MLHNCRIHFQSGEKHSEYIYVHCAARHSLLSKVQPELLQTFQCHDVDVKRGHTGIYFNEQKVKRCTPYFPVLSS